MPVSTNDVRVTVLAVPTVAMIVTAIRLVERARTRKLGLDDAFACLSSLLLMIYVVGTVMLLGSPSTLTREVKIALSYITSEMFYGVLWTARLSILFSIVRIAPSHVMRRLLYCLAGLFLFFWGILFAQTFWVCESEPSWKDATSPQCLAGTQVAIAQLLTDVFADVGLLAVPIKLLLNHRVSSGHHVRAILALSTSVITTVVSVVHAYYALRVGGLEELIVSIVENSITLIACNAVVIVTVIMRTVGIGGEDDSPGCKENYLSMGEYPGYRSPSVLKTINLSSTGGTKVEYGDAFKFGTIGRKSPSLWGLESGIHIQQEKVQVVSFPLSKGT